ncbi:MAG: Hsp70 family protein [Deltaproteobacteria bacterium]|nr:Hsp70 family protein [Deltaproteobacteria bacterium]
MSGDIIGIDLGTTNSCCAIVQDDGNVKIIPYRGGETTIPSIYAIDDKGNELVGYEAKRQWLLNPQRTVYGAKRLIGREFQSGFVKKMGEYFAYEMEAGNEGNVVIPLGDDTLNLSQVSAKILNTIRTVAADFLQKPISRAVVTVPAYFNDRQRQSVKDAGKMIDLEIVRIINEPTAAAMAYGIRQNLDLTVAIYDLGGGTFDVSVIEIRGRTFEVKATGGDIFLGGIDWDNALIQYIIGDFKEKNGVDLTEDLIAMQRIKDLAERTKIDLSSRTEAPFSIPFVTMTPEGTPLDINLVITRDKYEELTKPLVDHTIEIADMVVKDAGMEVHQLDEILLVGGQTRWPAVQNAVENYFKKPAAKNVHPDEAVAVGAALYAHSLETDVVDQKLQLLDVIPMAIGIEDAKGNLYEIFKKNASVPNQRPITFTTSYNDQEELAMRIYQGQEKEAQKNELLGEFEFSDIRKGPKGSVKVEVVFDCNVEGILSLSAHDKDTGVKMETTLKVAGTE